MGELVTPQATNRDEFFQECRSGKLDGVVVAYRTFGSVSITGLVDEELVDALPKSMKFLAHCGMWLPIYLSTLFFKMFDEFVSNFVTRCLRVFDVSLLRIYLVFGGRRPVVSREPSDGYPKYTLYQRGRL